MIRVLLLLSVILFAGCTTIEYVEVPAPKQFDCGLYVKNAEGRIVSWHCKSRVTDKCIKNEYVEAEACNSIQRSE